MKNNQNGHFDISLDNKIIFSYVNLFIIFLASVILTIIVITRLNDNIVNIVHQLSVLLMLQYGLLILGALCTGLTALWWIRRGRNVYLELLATLGAIYKFQAIIEFNMDGTIITANDKYLEAVGYTLDEIVAKHHNIFVDSDFKTSPQYKEFWNRLNRGEYEQADYKRLKKDGTEIWLQSSYNPIMDSKGNPIKVIKFATDITLRKIQESKLESLTENLREVGKQIITDSNEISVGINQLESSASAQASSASEQSTSITEISATIEEIKRTTQQTHEKAKLLGESAARTSKEAENGKSAVEKMRESMQLLQNKINQISTTILSLNDKTQQISEITETVADIARQSKLLSLNASIEAAKAGESGKGFAVVAGEVKDLAEKSQLSTERVQKILQDIRQTAEKAVSVTQDGTKSVETNIQQVKFTGDIIHSLGSVIEESSFASLQIVSAVSEESIAIDHIAFSMKEVEKVTGLFSSATQQTKQAIINLGKVSDSLKNTANAYQD